MEIYIPTGLICNEAIQCKSGEEKGSFLYSGECNAKNISDPRSRVSPIFPSLIGLYAWMKEQPIERIGDSHRWVRGGNFTF